MGNLSSQSVRFTGANCFTLLELLPFYFFVLLLVLFFSWQKNAEREEDVYCEIELILFILFSCLLLYLDGLQGAARLTKDDIEKVFSLYDRVCIARMNERLSI